MIVDVVFAVVIGAGPVGQGRTTLSPRYVGGRCGRGEAWHPGKASNADTGGQSEQPRKIRQSGVVDLDRSRGQELHQQRW